MVRVSAVAMVIVRVSARDWVNSTFSVMAIVSVRVRFMVILGVQATVSIMNITAIYLLRIFLALFNRPIPDQYAKFCHCTNSVVFLRLFFFVY